MAITQEVYVLNEGLSERRRTTSSGTKSRFTLDVKTEPLIFNLSEISLGRGPAEALKKAISDGIKSIAAVALPSTLLKRKYAKAGVQRGAPWAVKRYSGGRTGAKAPAQSDRLFNDSGRFAEGLHVMQNTKEGAWTVNVPANRLDPTTFKSQSDFIRMVERLRELVPVLRDPLSAPGVRAAMAASIDQMITKANDQNWKMKMAVVKQGIQLVKNLAAILGG
jgi:hypothetical protein